MTVIPFPARKSAIDAAIEAFEQAARDALADEGHFNDLRRRTWAALRAAIAKATGS